MAMIASPRRSSWPLDVDIKHLQCAGLPAASLVQMKLSALDQRLVIRKVGALYPGDAGTLRAALGGLLGQDSAG